MKRRTIKAKQMLARESARILVEEGVEDYQLAKQKAAKRLGFGLIHPLPGNEEIELAVGEYHRLFRSQVQVSHILKLKTVAFKAMMFLKAFSPRLVGSVVEGSAGRHSPVVIYLTAETPEPVVVSFLNAGIAFVEISRRGVIGARKFCYPALQFVLDGVRVEARILAEIIFREWFQSRKISPQYETIESLEKSLGQSPSAIVE
ncbi:MAG: hypothetical protein ACU843_01835 [Gammaproteobacteria bacterium]